MLALLVIVGCATTEPAPVPSLTTDDEFVLGDIPRLEASGLEPGKTYTIAAERIDTLGRLWESAADFTADNHGQIDIARDMPVDGVYSDADPYGLLWSMQMPAPPDNDWIAPEPLDYSQISYQLSVEDQSIAEASSRQWVFPPNIRRLPVDGDLRAELFLPEKSGSGYPAVLLLGGSGGGRAWASRTSALLANEGYAALALAYFKEESLPDHLAQIPLEYVEKAFDYLEGHTEIDSSRLGIIGYSKGAELALLLASREGAIRAVVAIAPGSAVFQGFKPPKFPTLSSWSSGGEDVPFVPNAYDDKFFKTYDGMYLWYRTLGQHAELHDASIAVENINGHILMLTGVEDRIWPTTMMAEQIVARLYLAEFQHRVKHMSFPEAGHGIAVPPGEPTTNAASRLGGTAEGNAYARERGWAAIKGFLADTLNQDQ